MKNLCLFDLDDTLLPIDSDHAWGEFMTRLGWVDATAFARRNDAFYAQYKTGELDIHAYIAFATEPLRAHTPAECAAAHRQFMADVIAPALHPSALELVRFVTAPIAQAFGIADLIAVRLARGAGGTITGGIQGTPSYRDGKVTRVEEWLVGQGAGWGDFGRISVYSDSVNDLPLLERATDAVATNPTPALRTIAEERGWRLLKLFD
jgi:phosphoserine phosphatase